MEATFEFTCSGSSKNCELYHEDHYEVWDGLTPPPLPKGWYKVPDGYGEYYCGSCHKKMMEEYEREEAEIAAAKAAQAD